MSALSIAACKFVPPSLYFSGKSSLFFINFFTVSFSVVISCTSNTLVPNSTIPIFTVPLSSINVLAKSVAAFLAACILVSPKVPEGLSILFELSNINTISSLPFVVTDALYGLALTDKFTLANLPFSKLSFAVAS